MPESSRSSLPDTATAVIDAVAGGGSGVAARVVDLQGFSTWPGDEIVVVEGGGAQHGHVPGGDGIRAASDALLARGGDRLGSFVVDIHGPAVVEAGLACGGRAELLLQPTSTIPGGLWRRLAARAPVALVTPLRGVDAAVASVVVLPDGRTEGDTEGGLAAVADAVTLLASGQGGTRRVADEGVDWLVEAWVPAPRLVVVGSGELVGAIDAQAGLLGWEARSVDGRPAEAADDGGGAAAEVAWAAFEEALAWAGASCALVVLSHDPHVDVPAIGAALDAGVPYIGAMGSRRTQSRQIERLEASGRPDGDLARIHRPIGLDLGGRSAPQLAIAICAEILASHCGRDGRSLSTRGGPIHDRPGAKAGA